MAASDGQLSCPLGIRGHVNAILNDKYSMSWISYCEAVLLIHVNITIIFKTVVFASLQIERCKFHHFDKDCDVHIHQQCWLVHPAKNRNKRHIKKIIKTANMTTSDGQLSCPQISLYATFNVKPVLAILSTKPTFLHILYLNHIEEIKSKSCMDWFLIHTS